MYFTLTQLPTVGYSQPLLWQFVDVFFSPSGRYHSYQKWTMAIFSWNSFAGTLNGTGLSLLSLIPPMLLPDLKRICLLWPKLIISLFYICCSLLYLSESSRYKCVKHWPNLLSPPAPFQFTALLCFFFLQLYVYHVVVCSEMKYRNCKFNTSHGHEGLYDL